MEYQGLPTPIIQEIFQHLANLKTYQLVVRTCKLFNAIADKYPITESADDNCKVFLRAMDNNNVDAILKFLRSGKIDPSFDNNYVIGWANQNSHLTVIQELIKDPRVDPSDEDDFAIKQASENGHLAVVQELLKHPKIDLSSIPDNIIKKLNGNCEAEISTEKLFNDADSKKRINSL